MFVFFIFIFSNEFCVCVSHSYHIELQFHVSILNKFFFYFDMVLLRPVQPPKHMLKHALFWYVTPMYIYMFRLFNVKKSIDSHTVQIEIFRKIYFLLLFIHFCSPEITFFYCLTWKWYFWVLPFIKRKPKKPFNWTTDFDVLVERISLESLQLKTVFFLLFSNFSVYYFFYFHTIYYNCWFW